MISNNLIDSVLVLDDDTNFTEQIFKALSTEHCKVTVTENSNAFFEIMQAKPPDVVLLKITLHPNPLSGIEVFRLLSLDQQTNSRLIIYSSSDTSPWINEVVRVGRFYLYTHNSPLTLNNLVQQVHTVLQIKKQEKENLLTQVENIFSKKNLFHSHPFIGESEPIKEARAKICRLAKSDEDMFVIGETGTGKEIAAFFYYFNSKRFGKPFQIVNCSALTETLIESELFGHIKGSFTSADRTKVGLFEMCDKGILFLDELTNLSLAAQSKLLRAIENKEIQIVGGESRQVDTKLIFASNSPINVLSRPEIIRNDLFYRIESNIVELVPLRERGDDILLLMNYFINRYATNNQMIDYKGIAQLKKLLLEYSWPGNVRELMNFCKSILINESDISPQVIKKHLQLKMMRSNTDNCIKQMENVYSKDIKKAVADFEKSFLIHHLNQSKWKICETARKIGIERTTLYKKMKQYKLEKHNNENPES
jgi:DNA-binding NtrC family response regulator